MEEKLNELKEIMGTLTDLGNAAAVLSWDPAIKPISPKVRYSPMVIPVLPWAI